MMLLGRGLDGRNGRFCQAVDALLTGLRSTLKIFPRQRTYWN